MSDSGPLLYVQCYYIGASDIAATKLIKSVTKPLSFSKPVEKICEDLKKKDGEICELRYGESITKYMLLYRGKMHFWESGPL